MALSTCTTLRYWQLQDNRNNAFVTSTQLRFCDRMKCRHTFFVCCGLSKCGLAQAKVWPGPCHFTSQILISISETNSSFWKIAVKCWSVTFVVYACMFFFSHDPIIASRPFVTKARFPKSIRYAANCSCLLVTFTGAFAKLLSFISLQRLKHLFF